VVANLTEHGVDRSRTTLIEGFFSDSLTDESKRSHNFRPVDVALIDCDLYSSTQEVLNWLNEYVRDGSILLFDDWYSYGTDESLGQQKAFSEYLEANKNYTAEPFVEFEEHGKGFIIKISTQRAAQSRCFRGENLPVYLYNGICRGIPGVLFLNAGIA
jgi:hypothetical protein